MSRLNVKPTRMELKKLKARLKTATRGHKLLKDKSDEMIRRFTVLLRENKRMRDEVGEELGEVLKEFAFAKGQMSSAAIENAFMMPVASLGIECGLTSIMNVEVPQIKVEERKSGDVYPYAFSAVTSEADYSVRRISAVISKLVALAEIEKQTAMLADEIEKNKRRVNALEYVMIPQLEETIHYIAAKLDENERASITRLMKVKSMIADRSGN